MKKIKFISLIAAGLLMLSACNGEPAMTKEEAVQYTKDHYSVAEVTTKVGTLTVKDNKNGEIDYHGEEVPDDIKDYAENMFNLANLAMDVDAKASTCSGLLTYLNEVRIEAMEAYVSGYKDNAGYQGKIEYSVANEEMTVTAALLAEIEPADGVEGYLTGYAMDYKATFNKSGLPVSVSMELGLALIEDPSHVEEGKEQHLYAISSSALYTVAW